MACFVKFFSFSASTLSMVAPCVIAFNLSAYMAVVVSRHGSGQGCPPHGCLKQQTACQQACCPTKYIISAQNYNTIAFQLMRGESRRGGCGSPRCGFFTHTPGRSPCKGVQKRHICQPDGRCHLKENQANAGNAPADRAAMVLPEFCKRRVCRLYKAQGMQLSYTDANALQHGRCGKIGAPAGQTILKSKWKVSEHTNDAKKYRAASIDNHEVTLQFYKFSKLSVQDSGVKSSLGTSLAVLLKQDVYDKISTNA